MQRCCELLPSHYLAFSVLLSLNFSLSHCLERTHDTSPKTNMVLQHKLLTANHGLKSLTLQYIEQSNACEQRVHKRAKFRNDEIPQAISRLDLLTTEMLTNKREFTQPPHL